MRMIQLVVDRFDEAKRILAFKEAEGDRYLFIGFGEKEAAEIGRAMRLEPFAPDANRATWMEMIEQRGANLDSVVITDLVDGVFKASVYLTQDGRSFDLPARPADAIAWELRQGLPVSATEVTVRIAASPVNLDAVYPFLFGPALKLKGENLGSSVASFNDHFAARYQRIGKRAVKAFAVFFLLFGMLMFGKTLPYLI